MKYKPVTFRAWKKKALKNRKFSRAYIKLLERWCRAYERYFLDEFNDLPNSPKDVKRFRK